jgi:hypothetical protein
MAGRPKPMPGQKPVSEWPSTMTQADIRDCLGYSDDDVVSRIVNRRVTPGVGVRFPAPDIRGARGERPKVWSKRVIMQWAWETGRLVEDGGDRC